MRRLIVTTFVSADGVMETPENWTSPFRSAQGRRYKLDELLASDALLMGRVTYGELAAAWPGMADSDGFADQMNSMKKYVVSSTLTRLPWNNSHRISGDVAAAVTALKREPGQSILVPGSATLVNALLRHRLVDEYRLMTFPVIAGSGKRLFGDGNPRQTLELAGAASLPNGVTVLTYRPVSQHPDGAFPRGRQ